VLRAGDRAVLPRGGPISAERGAASTDDLAWTDGRLVFDNATLAQVAAELRRWYGIELQFADSALAARHFTASFRGESAEQVLDVLALALDVETQRTGGTVVVRRKE
jgi:transmembrane sensor